MLRLDGDWYESTMVCLENLWSDVVPGGVIIVDDYYLFNGCTCAVHDFLSKRRATERIQRRRDVCFLIKNMSDVDSR